MFVWKSSDSVRYILKICKTDHLSFNYIRCAAELERNKLLWLSFMRSNFSVSLST